MNMPNGLHLWFLWKFIGHCALLTYKESVDHNILTSTEQISTSWKFANMKLLRHAEKDVNSTIVYIAAYYLWNYIPISCSTVQFYKYNVMALNFV